LNWRLKKMTKAELQAALEEAAEKIKALEEKLGHESLNGEAIQNCRALLRDIGHEGAYFDDVIRRVVVEIKALRYDAQRYSDLKGRTSVWSVEEQEREAPKRPDDFFSASWVALAT
jgi:hypothetical protein